MSNTVHIYVWDYICARICSLTHFWQKFRESNVFTIEITKYIVDLTKYFFGETKFFIFPHCGNYGNLLPLKKYFVKHLFSNFFSKTVTFTKFLPKYAEVNSRNFHTVHSIVDFWLFSWNHFFNQSFSNTAFSRETVFRQIHCIGCLIYFHRILITFRTSITPQISSTFIYILVLTLKLVCNFRTLPHRHLLPHSTLLYVLQKL